MASVPSEPGFHISVILVWGWVRVYGKEGEDSGAWGGGPRGELGTGRRIISQAVWYTWDGGKACVPRKNWNAKR